MTQTEALRMALEALEKPPLEMVEDRDGHMVFVRDKAITAIREVLAQPEQEPVAWMCRRRKGEIPFVYSVAQLNELGYGNISVPPFEKIAPLYTTPPQRTWQGLTDEDVMAIAFNFDLSSLSLVAKAIESTLKEKNT